MGQAFALQFLFRNHAEGEHRLPNNRTPSKRPAGNLFYQPFARQRNKWAVRDSCQRK